MSVKGKVKEATGFIKEEMNDLCVPKIRFCNIGGEGRRELGVI